LVTNDHITAMMLEMADDDDHLHQSIAAELIVQTVSKHERATTILKVIMLVSIAFFLRSILFTTETLWSCVVARKLIAIIIDMIIDMICICKCTFAGDSA
uniref:Protein unc-45 homolog B (inferred by orthology to a human protein) n=1 Tax=Anisakis simplex TaxID=6269 RepID=A0A0M3JIX3_ANISI